MSTLESSRAVLFCYCRLYVYVILPVTSVCFASIEAELNEVQLQNFLPDIEIMATNEQVAFWAVKYTCVLKCISYKEMEESSMVYREHNLTRYSSQPASQNTAGSVMRWH